MIRLVDFYTDRIVRPATETEITGAKRMPVHGGPLVVEVEGRTHYLATLDDSTESLESL